MSNATMVGKASLALFLQHVQELVEEKREAGVSECILLGSAFLSVAEEWGVDLDVINDILRKSYMNQEEDDA